VENGVSTAFRLSLDFLGEEPRGLRFRVAFDASQGRWLLRYPQVTGLKFVPIHGGEPPKWLTSLLVSAPQDEFVLNPDDRIAFDLFACVSDSGEKSRWYIDLAPADYEVRYVLEVQPGNARSDYLNKGSRFADMTPPWVGAIESNSIAVSFRQGKGIQSLDGLGARPTAAPMSAERLAELLKRDAEMDAQGDSGLDWPTLRARIERG